MTPPPPSESLGKMLTGSFQNFVILYSMKSSLKNKFLTHCNTILHFDALKIYSCGKHCEKRRNCF